MWNRAVNWALRNHDSLVIMGGLMGANVGVYYAAKDDDHYFFMGSLGFIAGCGLGALSPVIVPVALLSTPGYVFYKVKNGFEDPSDRLK